jgi:hypothetical protein
MTQNTAILKHLQRGRTLTPLQALSKFDCWALSSRTSDLKKMGYDVRKDLVTKGGKTFAKYYLVKP